MAVEETNSGRELIDLCLLVINLGLLLNNRLFHHSLAELLGKMRLI